MGRKRRKSQYWYGKWQRSILPILIVTSNPKGPENAIDLDQIQISQGFCHINYRVEAVRHLNNHGFKDVKFREQYYQIPSKCPRCREEGKATFSLDGRIRSKKWVDRAPPIQLNYHHGSKKHYVGTWKNGNVHLSPNVESFESLLMNSKTFEN